MFAVAPILAALFLGGAVGVMTVGVVDACTALGIAALVGTAGIGLLPGGLLHRTRHRARS